MIVHELGHLIGLWHEQSRFDRDAHVNILLNNVREEFRYNYNKLHEMRLMAPYDLSSIMHYGLKVC
jgi:astacin-like metalloendopeptidase